MVTYVTRISNISFYENFLHARFISISFQVTNLENHLLEWYEM